MFPIHRFGKVSLQMTKETDVSEDGNSHGIFTVRYMHSFLANKGLRYHILGIHLRTLFQVVLQTVAKKMLLAFDKISSHIISK